MTTEVLQRYRTKNLRHQLLAVIRMVWEMVTRSMLATVIIILGAVLIMCVFMAFKLTLEDKAVPAEITGLLTGILGLFSGILIKTDDSRSRDNRDRISDRERIQTFTHPEDRER